jgi:hypothetical protein
MGLLYFPLMIAGLAAGLKLYSYLSPEPATEAWEPRTDERPYGNLPFFLPVAGAFVPTFFLYVVIWLRRLFPAATSLSRNHLLRWFARLGRKSALSDIVVVRTSDADWRATVIELLRHADFVVVDLTAASQNLKWEVEAIAAARQPVKTIWMFADEVPARAEPPIRLLSAGGYEVCGVRFEGRPRIIKYPRDADGSEYQRWRGMRMEGARTRQIASLLIDLFDELQSDPSAKVA